MNTKAKPFDGLSDKASLIIIAETFLAKYEPARTVVLRIADHIEQLEAENVRLNETVATNKTLTTEAIRVFDFHVRRANKAEAQLQRVREIWVALDATGRRMCEVGVRERDDGPRVKSYADELDAVLKD